MYKLWNDECKFPNVDEMKNIEDIKYVDVHTAVEGEYQFLLGAAIIKFKNKMYASWGNSYRKENDDNTILAEKSSIDMGKTWTDYRKISKRDAGFGRSHGVYFEYDGSLYAFCPKAKYDKIDAYPELKMEAYKLNEQGEWVCLGVVLEEDFWPMCQPIILDDGSFLMAGLKTNTAEAAVALCPDGDVTKWTMKVIPNPQKYEYWGETTVLKCEDKLVAIVRGGKECECILVSESYDNGKTWSGLEKSNFEISNSKMYTGTLSNGTNYLVFNAKSKVYRETLCISTGKDFFEKVYIIKHRFDTAPKFFTNNEWSYPYAYEADGKLYVIYAKNKEDCELAIIPLESLE